MYYNYQLAMTADIINWIQNNVSVTEYASREELYDDMMDILWAADEITGNGYSGYDTMEKCEQYLLGNTDLLFEAIQEFGVPKNNSIEIYGSAAQHADCLIRLLLFPNCLQAACEEVMK